MDVLTLAFVVELDSGFASLSIVPTIRVTRILYPICGGQRGIACRAWCIICFRKGVRYYRTHASIQDTQGIQGGRNNKYTQTIGANMG